MLIAAEPASELLSGMIRGMSLTLGLDVASEEEFDDAFSLEGISAALLWIDAAQNKVGAPRVAEAPQSLPEVSPEIRQAQQQFAPESVTETLNTLCPASPMRTSWTFRSGTIVWRPRGRRPNGVGTRLG